MRSGTHRRLIAWRMFALGMASLALGQHAQAATKSWIGGNANWSVGGNWTGGSVPVAGDAVILNQSGSVTSTFTSAVTPSVLALVDISNSMTMLESSGVFQATNFNLAPATGAASFTINGGSGTVTSATLGAAAFGHGSMNINGGIFAATGSIT